MASPNIYSAYSAAPDSAKLHPGYMLVSAFAGTDNIRHAVENRYRFFRYGDAMLIERQ